MHPKGQSLCDIRSHELVEMGSYLEEGGPKASKTNLALRPAFARFGTLDAFSPSATLKLCFFSW